MGKREDALRDIINALHIGLPAAEHIARFEAQIRADAYEQAAKVCEQQARDFLSEQYAVGQPMSSISERFACQECATAIRALSDQPDSTNEGLAELLRELFGLAVAQHLIFPDDGDLFTRIDTALSTGTQA